MQINRSITLHDALRFIKTLTFRKSWNGIKLYAGMYLSDLIKKPVLWGKPVTVTIEPTTKCNLSCPECQTGNKSLNRSKEDIPLSKYIQIIDEIKPYTAWLQLYFQGEPLIHKDIDQMISYAHKEGIYSCISTNGHFLTKAMSEKLIESGLDRLIISLDGADKDTYEKYRIGGDFNKVVKGIQTLQKIKKENRKKHPLIILQFIVFHHNEHQVNEIKKLGRKIGADKVDIKSTQIYNYSSKENLIPEQIKYSRYKKENKSSIKLKNKLKNFCPRLWLTTVITSEGEILPCCFDKYGEYKMGEWNNQNIYAIWQSASYNNFRTKILSSRSSVSICRNCIE